MSADFLIYSDHLEAFDRSDFELWCLKLGYEVELHPDFTIRDEGFVPIRFRSEFLGQGSYLTGFELFSSENDSADMTAPVYAPPVKEPGFFAKLFGKKQPPAAIPPAQPSPYEREAGEKRWEICCTCHAEEPLTELMAYLFSAYFVEKFGAVTDDPQTGKRFNDPGKIKAEVEAIRRDMMENYRSWGQEFIPFTGWDME